MKKKVVKGITKKATKPVVKAKPVAKKKSVDTEVGALMTMIEEVLRQRAPEPVARPVAFDLGQLSQPQGEGIREIKPWFPAVNDEWSRENMMAKISTLESRVEMLSQALLAFQTDLVNAKIRRA